METQQIIQYQNVMVLKLEQPILYLRFAHYSRIVIVNIRVALLLKHNSKIYRTYIRFSFLIALLSTAKFITNVLHEKKTLGLHYEFDTFDLTKCEITTHQQNNSATTICTMNSACIIIDRVKLKFLRAVSKILSKTVIVCSACLSCLDCSLGSSFNRSS